MTGASGNLVECGDAHEHWRVPLFLLCIELIDFFLGRGEANRESFDLAESAFALRFGDPVGEVVTDFDQSCPLGRGDDQDGASDACVLVDAVSSVSTSAVPEGEFASLEVSEELLPFLRRDSSVFLRRSKGATTCDEGLMRFDGIRRVDGGVSHCGVDIVVTCNDLGDVRWQAVEDGVGDEDSPKVVGLEVRGVSGSVGYSWFLKCFVEGQANGPIRYVTVLATHPPLVEEWHRGVPDFFVVIARDSRKRSVSTSDPGNHRTENVGEFWSHEQESLLIGFRRRNLKERNDVAGCRQFVADDAVVA